MSELKIDLEYKILFLGDSSVGKTSLLLRYVDHKFDNSLPTVGVDVRVKYITYENKKIKITIWDTAGQERFRGIAKNYFRGANGIIVVFDITNKDSFDKLKLWMVDAKQNMNKSTQLIIAENKIDLEQKRQVSKDTIQDFGEKNNIEIYPTSAKTGEGVEEILEKLISKLFLNKEIGKPDEDDESSRRKDSVVLDKNNGEKNRPKEGCNC